MRYSTNLSAFLRLQDVKINFEGFENIYKSYNIFVDTVKEQLFIFDYAAKYSLHNPVNLLANLLIITLTSVVTWTRFYVYRTNSH